MIALKRIGGTVDFLDKGSQKWDYMAWRLLRLVFKRLSKQLLSNCYY